MLKTCLEKVKQSGPLVHNITNYVTVNDVANAILACGASPIMADEPEDAEEITAVCAGLNLNIGTLSKRTVEAMFRAGGRAKQLEHPILLDPVGAGASSMRTKTAMCIIEELHPTVIRGNISEIKTLANGFGTTRGVDADTADCVTEENLSEQILFVKKFAAKTGACVAVTGAIDLVSDGVRCAVVRNGHRDMAKITGTGCQLSGIMTAYVAANPQKIFEACVTATCLMGVCGEIARICFLPKEGNVTYRNRIIDAVFHMDGETLEKGALYEIR